MLLTLAHRMINHVSGMLHAIFIHICSIYSLKYVPIICFKMSQIVISEPLNPVVVWIKCLTRYSNLMLLTLSHQNE